jgi:uncharacterized protein
LSPSIVAFLISIKSKTAKELLGQVRTDFNKRLLIPAVFLVPLTSLLSFLVVHIKVSTIPVPMLMMGLIWPLFSSFGEEFGWRSYAFPRFYKQYGFTKAVFSIGFFWGVWHLPMDYIGLRSHGWYFVPEFLLLGPGLLTAHSIIMSYLYIRGNGNIVLPILYHYTITASAIILPAFLGIETPKTFGFANLIQPIATNVILWAIAIFILLKGKRSIINPEKDQ